LKLNIAISFVMIIINRTFCIMDQRLYKNCSKYNGEVYLDKS